MPWFECSDCGESVQKPKVKAHLLKCSASGFSCLDCSQTFDRHSVGAHTSCVTEHAKYAQGATKPGGAAASGSTAAAPGAGAPGAKGGAPAGLEFLTTRAPWRCNLCNTACTSQATLLGHASGTKHLRKVRGAQKAVQLAGSGAAGGAEQPATPAPAAPEPAAAEGVDARPSKKGKKRKEAPAAEAPAAEAQPATPPQEQAAKKRKKKGQGHPDDEALPATAAAVPEGKKPKKGKGAPPEAAAGLAPAAPAAAEQPSAAAGEGPQAEAAEGAPVLGPKRGGGKGPPWKRAAAQVLAAQGGKLRMRVKKLQLKVLERVAPQPGGWQGLSPGERAAWKVAMLASWRRSRRFRFDDAKGMVAYLGVPAAGGV